MTFPFGHDVRLVTRTPTGTQDAYGDDTYTDTTVTVSGAYAPVSSAENVQGQDQVISQPTVYLPFDTVLSPSDAVEIPGAIVGIPAVDWVRFEVDGLPNPWRSPFTGWEPGVEVKLRRTTG